MGEDSDGGELPAPPPTSGRCPCLIATATAIVAASALFRSSVVSGSVDCSASSLENRPATLGRKAVNRDSNASKLKAVATPINVMVRASLVSKLMSLLLPSGPISEDSTLQFLPIPHLPPSPKTDTLPLVSLLFLLLASPHEQNPFFNHPLHLPQPRHA